MNKVRASMTLVVLLGAGLANFVGCTTDEPPPDNPSSSSGSGSSSGAATTCGDGKLDKNEACDDGNNADGDGCTECAKDECYECTGEEGQVSACTVAASAAVCQSTKVCDGAGKCVECVADAQCTGGYCNQNVCAKCDDTMKNGDETDADCGGTHCPPCAQGKLCAATTDCMSTFCSDGFCCAEVCDGPCLACNIGGSEGTCDLVARYGEDPSYGMGESCATAAGEACNGGGTCAKALGQACTGPAQCASTKCVDLSGGMNKVCLRTTGDSCATNEECFNNMCDPGTMKCL